MKKFIDIIASRLRIYLALLIIVIIISVICSIAFGGKTYFSDFMSTLLPIGIVITIVLIFLKKTEINISMEVIYFFVRLIKTTVIHLAVIFLIFNIVEYLFEIAIEKFNLQYDESEGYGAILASIITIVYLFFSLRSKIKFKQES
ncbi:hypothetical protein NAT51_10090 [Flavobacterium amniphilum]|uniref:hypothetical protein n=1 Tax=Flavobacterium amniphilum TaxID=1834035 RepID=UPI00202AC02B|nr:hypothetical protein [Flavobacterium amniphilum]MCL9805873.1 hypothetical protein [Flavobacterium amniphilum]